MKKLTILLLLFSGVSFGQIGEAAPVKESVVIGVASKSVGLPKLERVEDLYILSFYNLEYPSLRYIENIGFYASEEELNTLYNFLLSQFDTKETKTITLGHEEIMVSKHSGSLRIAILHSDQWFYLSKKQLKRLFDR